MKMNGKLIYLLFASLLFRLISLNQSLWLDETTTANVVRKFGYMDIVTHFSPHDFHPPLYYLLMKFWTNLFGYSEVVLRLPSVIFSVLTGFAIYLIVHSQRSIKSAALWAAALFLFNPLIVYYSQEARMYSMVTLLVTLTFWCVSKIHTASPKLQVKYLFLANIFISLSLGTFYGSVFFIASLYLYLLIKKEFKLLTYLLPGAVFASALLSPLFIAQLKNSGEVLKAMPNWSLTLGKANLKNLLLIPIKLTSGRLSFDPKWRYYGIAAVWVTYVSYWLARLALQTKKYNEYFFYLKTPVILGFIVSFYKPLLQYFRFIYIVPFMAILLAIAVHKSWQRYVLLGGFILFSSIYLFFPSFHREDWRSMVPSLPSKTVWALPTATDPVSYYDGDIAVLDLRQLKAESKQIIIIPYAAEIYGFDYKTDLTKKGYKHSREVSFRGLAYSVWTVGN